MRVSITSSLMQQCRAPRLVAVTKFKTTKMNFSDFPRKLDPTKITRHIVVVYVKLCLWFSKHGLRVNSVHDQPGYHSLADCNGRQWEILLN